MNMTAVAITGMICITLIVLVMITNKKDESEDK
jgi:hypothetical protein